MRLLTLALLLAADDPPIPAGQRLHMDQELDAAIEKATATIKENSKAIDAYSSRGDALFKRGRFTEAADDYEKMVELDPKLDTGHWRRGIACFYAGRFEKAARQFEIYHSFDDVDRENGIWRYFSQYKAAGKDKAKAGLLKYAKDDRQPFPAVYQLFEGKRRADQVLADVEAAKLGDDEKEQRRFYAYLYVGLNAAVEGRAEEAATVLRKAVENKWAPQAGYGPEYMWHVGRVHYDLLVTPKKD
ncbi:MAG TPA: tetratricopeptide repeat protein [Planctomycetota bacterium]|nr:tetratricopeptide repeat protein [Planctomycetota bacterium]